MMSQQYTINNPSNNQRYKGKQEGAALMTVMVFLVLMTIVTVSATKISILDILVSGNDHQKSLTIQETYNNLKQLSHTSKLDLAIAAGFDASDQYQLDESTTEVNKVITEIVEKYPCERAGNASSMGPGAPPCEIYDFRVKYYKQGSGAREEQHQGGGKMVPNAGSKGSML